MSRSPRMQQIEDLLADDPTDAFLRYGLAMEYASIGDEATAALKLQELIQETPYVPAFLQAGQILNRIGKVDEAISALKQGIREAQKQNDLHAMGEMQGLLGSIE